MQKQSIIVEDLGEMNYQEAWNYQEMLLRRNLAVKSRALQLEQPTQQPNLEEAESSEEATSTTNYLLFVQHPPVYTLGKSGKAEHVLLKEQERKERGIEFFHTNRGGDITYHGPGQIVGYPI